MKTYWYLLIAAVAYYLYSQKKTVDPANYATALNAIGGYGSDGLPLTVQPIDVGATLTSEFATNTIAPYVTPVVNFQPGPNGAN